MSKYILSSILYLTFVSRFAFTVLQLGLGDIAISRSESQMSRLRYERDIASLVSDLRSVY